MTAAAYVTLPNRRRLRIRPLRHCEEQPIRELYAHLSARSRYMRFFSAMPTLPDTLVRQLACVDGERRVAFVAEDETDGRVEPVALASFGAIDDTTVELGLVVRDEWQNQRLGTALATCVLDAAEARGFHRFVASIHTHNTAIRRLLYRVGIVVSSTFESGVFELAFVRRHASASS
ncbi:MAG TPA: GNAT family protein [Vicinamibacterales bacterium]|nr:GNAT family protein [Vicinamibacterales bacterium]